MKASSMRRLTVKIFRKYDSRIQHSHNERYEPTTLCLHVNKLSNCIKFGHCSAHIVFLVNNEEIDYARMWT